MLLKIIQIFTAIRRLLGMTIVSDIFTLKVSIYENVVLFYSSPVVSRNVDLLLIIYDS